MAPSRRAGSIETVIGCIWEITFLFFFARAAFVYAALAVAATALLACLAHAAVLPFLAAQQRVPVQTLLASVLGAANSSTKTALLGLVVALVAVVVAVCSRVLMDYSEIPQQHRFRVAIGAVAAGYVGLGWAALRLFAPSFCGQTPINAETTATTPTPVNSHAATPTTGATMSLAAFCQQSRVVIHCNTFSVCTVVGAVFVAAVALMPWLSMVLLERPSRRYGHQRTASNTGWASPSKAPASQAARSVSEKKPLTGAVSDSSSDDEEAAPRRTRAPTTPSETDKKRYSLRSPSERRSTRR